METAAKLRSTRRSSSDGGRWKKAGGGRAAQCPGACGGRGFIRWSRETTKARSGAWLHGSGDGGAAREKARRGVAEAVGRREVAAACVL